MSLQPESQPIILIAGATGFIGRPLTRALAEKGHALRCLSRADQASLPPGVQRVKADLLDPPSLEPALEGVDTAYYLVHSLDAGVSRFAERDRTAAINFSKAAENAGVRRVIFLSGLGEPSEHLSAHLQSRHEVADILRQGAFATTVLRAAVILGAGGASFELIRFLVKTQPVIPDLKGLDTHCQPIALANALRYLTGCLDEEKTAGQSFDIGGPEVLTYRQMLEGFARVANDINLFLPVPFFSSRLTAWLLGVLSPVRADTALALLHGLGNEVICRENRIRGLIRQKLIPYEEAIRLALQITPARP